MIVSFINKIKYIFINLDKKTFIILKHGLQFCLSLALIAISILFTYEVLYSIPLIYNIGLLLFRISLIFSIEFIICAIAIDKIKNQ